MQVDIWSDVACPWCAVGKRRFETALEEFAHREDVDVRWRSFELDPSAPRVRDGDYVGRLATKYGTSREDAQSMIDTMTRTGAEVGFTFRFDIIRPGNTFDAHRLLHLAGDRGVQAAVKERFLAGYLGEGRAIGDPDVLEELAVEAGLDRADVTEVLSGDAYADAVRADEEQARTYGIHAVPFFVVDGRYGISGAQPSHVLAEALRQVWHEQPPRTGPGPADHADAEACRDGVCAV